MAQRWSKSARVVREWKKNVEDFKLGHFKLTQLEEDIFVFQILAQKGLKSTQNEILLKYEALRQGLSALSEIAVEWNASIHMPRIGAGQAGGEWLVIEGMIYEELVNNGANVTVYDLPGTKYIPKEKEHSFLQETLL